MRMTPRQAAGVAGVLKQEEEERVRLREEAHSGRASSRRNESLLSGRDYSTIVTRHVVPEVVSEATRVFDSLTRRVFDKLSGALAHVGGDVTSGGVLREDLDRFDPEEMSSLKEAALSRVATAVSTYVEKVSRHAGRVKLPAGVLNEDYARGIPDFALQQVASNATDELRRLLRNHINQTSPDPSKQRQMLAAANVVLKETEKDVKELLEDKLARYMRNV